MQEHSDNAITLEKRIEELETLIANNELSGFSPQAKEVSSLFKSLRLSRNDREHLWFRYQECWTMVKVEWEKNAQTLRENAQILSEELNALDALAEKNLYKDFWQKTKEISSLFKSLKCSREPREKLWQRFQDTCDKVKAQREQLESESESSKNRILSRINDARWEARSAFDQEGFTEVRDQLNEVMAMLKNAILIKAHRDECWDAYRQENESLQRKREEKQSKDYGDLKLDIGVIKDTLRGTLGSDILNIVEETATLGAISAEEHGEPHRALQLIRDAQQKLQSAFLSKDQRQELRERLQELWDEAIEAIKTQKEFKRQKHEAWRERTEAARDRKQERLKNSESFIDRLESQIEDLEQKISDSTHDDWIEKAEGWIQEKRDKIAEVREQNEELQQQIDDIEEKLEEQ